jgi:TolA-binding protein
MIAMVENSGSGAASEDRIAALEKTVTDMEALVKGLTEEFLDLRTIIMKMSKETEKRSLQELKRLQRIVQGAQVPGVVAGRSPPQAQGSRTINAEPKAPTEPSMDMIMQTDGTKKPEVRGGNFIVASSGNGRSKKGVSTKPEQSKIS